MGQRHFLTAFRAVITAGDFASFSWGPFTGTLRLRSLYFRSTDTLVTRTTLGLFISQDPDVPEGAFTNPFTGRDGWTPLSTASLFTPGNNDDITGFFLPFQPVAAGTPLILPTIDLDVRGSLFYLKALIRNATAGGISVHLALAVEENPADADPAAVVPRPQPGAPTPAPPPPRPTPPPPSPPVTAPPAPPPGPAPTLPLPGPQTIPPITIDPLDAPASARQIIQA